VQYVTTKQPVTIGYFINASMNPHESKLLQHFLFREQFIMPMDRVLVKDPSIERNRIELTQVTEGRKVDGMVGYVHCMYCI
jgi:hypothetical protein